MDLQSLRARIPQAPSWLFAAVGVGAFAFLVSVYVGVWTPDYGITKFLTAGTEFDARGIAAYRATPKYLDPYPPHRWGFDGQLYAELALDPLLRDPDLGQALDNPPYRARRILLSWLAWLGGLGRPFWVLNVFAALNLVFWIGYAWLAAKLFRPHGWAGLAGFSAVLLTCGIIECMHGSLTDFPSFVLMTTAVVLGGTGGAVVLALAALARETSVLGFIGLAEFRPPWGESLRKNLVRGLITAVPLALWFGYVVWQFRHREIGFDGGNLERPLAGMMGKLGEFSVTAFHGPIRWRRVFFELYKSYDLHAVLTIVAVFTQCLYLSVYREWENRLWRMAAIFVPYFLCIGFLSWESHFTVTRHALPITLVFNLLLAIRPRRGWLVWFLIGNCFVPFGVHYFWRQPLNRPPAKPAEFALVTSVIDGSGVQVAYANGWSPQQWNGVDTWRWGAGQFSELSLRNEAAQALAGELSFLTRSPGPRELRVALRNETIWSGRLAGGRQTISIALNLPPGETRLVFSTQEPPTSADDTTPGNVTFMVANPRIRLTPSVGASLPRE